MHLRRCEYPGSGKGAMEDLEDLPPPDDTGPDCSPVVVSYAGASVVQFSASAKEKLYDELPVTDGPEFDELPDARTSKHKTMCK